MDRRLAVLAIALALALPCAAGAERHYAVLSIVGDRLLVAGPKPIAGAPAGPPTYIELGDPAIDAAVLRAVNGAVARADPGARTTLLLARDPALFKAEERALDETRDVRVLLAAIRPLLGNIPGTHLILVSKLRSEARMRFANRYYDASGRLEGAGFYVDRARRVADADTGQVEYGFLGLFAYFKVTLIQLDGDRILGEEEIIESTTHAIPGVDPWEGLPAAEKVGLLKALLDREVGRGTARLLR